VWDAKQGGAGGEQFNAGARDIERKEELCSGKYRLRVARLSGA